MRKVAKRDQAGSERVQRFVHNDFGFIVIRHRRPQNIGKLNQLAVHLSIAQPLGSQARTSGYIGSSGGACHLRRRSEGCEACN